MSCRYGGRPQHPRLSACSSSSTSILTIFYFVIRRIPWPLLEHDPFVPQSFLVLLDCKNWVRVGQTQRSGGYSIVRARVGEHKNKCHSNFLVHSIERDSNRVSTLLCMVSCKAHRVGAENLNYYSGQRICNAFLPTNAHPIVWRS